MADKASADGPANLLQAVNLAADPAAKDRGAMIVLNDRIGAALYTIKTNANTLETFKATEQGYLGMFLSSKPVFYYPAVQPIFKKTFDITNITELPKVDVLYGYAFKSSKTHARLLILSADLQSPRL